MKRTTRFMSTALLVLVSSSALTQAAPLQDTSLVRVNVLVTETSRDRAVRGLAKENFQIWEDGVAQDIVSMTPGSVDGEYVLAFKSTNTAKDGTWRKLRAKIVSPKGLDETRVAFSVLFQSGYYAPPAGN